MVLPRPDDVQGKGERAWLQADADLQTWLSRRRRPHHHGVGPVYATRKILARTGMKISDFDIFEVNEAFACVVRYFVREMGIPEKDVWSKG